MASQIYFILDGSGSMHSFVNDTIGGFNSFVSSQQSDNSDGTMSLFLFNDTVTSVYKNKPIENVEKLTSETYFPAGTTALCDAIGVTIKYADTQNGEKKIIVILTDGDDNTSKDYTKNHINDLIEIKKKEGWQFVFLAANQDAINTATQYGIGNNAAMTFNQDHTEDTFECLSAAIGRQVTGESQDVEFTGLERMKSCPPPDQEPCVRPEYSSMAGAYPHSPGSACEVFTGVVHDSVVGLGRC